MNQNITVFIGLGTNVGDRPSNLSRALEGLRPCVRVERCSSIYETEPVDYEDQGWFLNQAVKGVTALEPAALLDRLQQLEAQMGRQRQVPKGPRVIDLDILFYGERIIDLENLSVPHPEIQNRGFVLEPLNEIDPGWVHPKLKQDIRTLLAALGQEKEVKRWIPEKLKS